MRQVGMDDVDKLAAPSIPGYLGSNKGHPVKEGVLHERLHHESAPGNTEIGNIDNQTSHLYTLMYQPKNSGLIHIQRYVI